ncbi:hypothetical protein HOD88_00780 [archaeon]|jgi:hypothetical protein|nr:hypothetical protein [archaeon]
MKRKFILTGTDNDGFRHRYSARKIEKFKVAFSDLMKDLGFEPNPFLKLFEGGFYDENEEFIAKDRLVKEIIDECFHFQNENYDVDLFFGDKRIIFVIRTKARDLLVNHLYKNSNWIRPLEIKRIPEKENLREELPVVVRNKQ